jgi:hypothetical protein
MLLVIKDLFTNIFELFSLIILIHYIQNIQDNLFNYYYHNRYKLGTIKSKFSTILVLKEKFENNNINSEPIHNLALNLEKFYIYN